MAYLSADDFLVGILGEAVDYEMAGVGLVRIRPLSMAEVQRIRKVATDDELALTVQTVAAGLESPRLTPEQVEKLSDGAAGHIADLAQRIMALSGMAQDETVKK